MQSDIRQLEEDLAAHKSFLDKIRRIALEEDKKRFRSGLVTSALESTVTVGQIGDALVELLQKCLFDDDKEKKTLQSTLERVITPFSLECHILYMLYSCKPPPPVSTEQPSPIDIGVKNAK